MSIFRLIASTMGISFSMARKIARQTCDVESNVVIVGAGEGRVLDIFLDVAPRGNHYVFEPHPVLRKNLEKRYTHFNCNVSECMVSDEASEMAMTYTLPVLVKADKPGKQDRVKQFPTQVVVTTGRLDNLLPADYAPVWIVINTTTTVLKVLTGAQKTIANARPHILFQQGLVTDGGDAQDIVRVYKMLVAEKLRLSTMDKWLGNRPCFTEQEFMAWCKKNQGKAFIAYP